MLHRGLFLYDNMVSSHHCLFTYKGGFDTAQKVCLASIYLAFLSKSIYYEIMNPQFKPTFKRALSCGRYGDGNADPNHSRNGARREIGRRLETAENAVTTITHQN